MADHSAIEWTDATWNPTTGCTKISPGCAHCYIERTPAFRIPGNRFVKGKTDITIFHDRLEQPLHWKKPRRVFVNSLSDLFHEDISDAFIDRVFAVMALAPQHTFQVLTKRPARMRDYLNEPYRKMEVARHIHARVGDEAARAVVAEWGWPLPNVWLGVSVENQHFADERIPLLLQTPAAVRFISAEPLLGPVNLDRVRYAPIANAFVPALSADRRLGCLMVNQADRANSPTFPRLDWVIVGGESGPGARPFDLAWARSIVRQCQAAGLPVFVKQLGANPWVKTARHYGPGVDAHPYNMRYQLKDKKGGDIAEWPADLSVREFPEAR